VIVDDVGEGAVRKNVVCVLWAVCVCWQVFVYVVYVLAKKLTFEIKELHQF
jgi:hypothetical protein